MTDSCLKPEALVVVGFDRWITVQLGVSFSSQEKKKTGQHILHMYSTVQYNIELLKDVLDTCKPPHDDER